MFTVNRYSNSPFCVLWLNNIVSTIHENNFKSIQFLSRGLYKFKHIDYWNKWQWWWSMDDCTSQCFCFYEAPDITKYAYWHLNLYVTSYLVFISLISRHSFRTLRYIYKCKEMNKQTYISPKQQVFKVGGLKNWDIQLGILLWLLEWLLLRYSSKPYCWSFIKSAKLLNMWHWLRPVIFHFYM